MAYTFDFSKQDENFRRGFDVLMTLAPKFCRPGGDWIQIHVQKTLSGQRILFVGYDFVHPAFIDECCISLDDYSYFMAECWTICGEDGRLQFESIKVCFDFTPQFTERKKR